jgi:tetratricopeptide (TPR) repeat protein
MSAITGLFQRYARGGGGDGLPSPKFAAALFRRGRLLEAEAWCRRILRAVPGHDETLLLQAEILLAREGEAAFRQALGHAESLKAGNAETLCRIGLLWARIGDYDNAARLYRRAQQLDFNAAGWLREFAETEEAAGRLDSARLLYDLALPASPGTSRIHTRRACLMLRREWGAPLPAPPDKRQEPGLDKRIAMTQLGEMGRFGKQLRQYLALRIYGRMHRLRVEVPDWAGRWLFDLDDPYPSGPLPVLNETPGLMEKLLTAGPGESFANRDFVGYFDGPPQLYLPHRDFIRALFRPGERVRPRLENAMARLMRHGRTLVALHISRGDLAGSGSWVAPTHWYLDWVARIWHTLDAPVLYLVSDRPGIAGQFQEFAPRNAADTGEEIPGAKFFMDFHVMTQADKLAVSPGGYSMIAAWLNRRATRFMRPNPSNWHLTPYDPWKS